MHNSRTSTPIMFTSPLPSTLTILDISSGQVSALLFRIFRILGINPHIIDVGADISMPLCQIAGQRFRPFSAPRHSPFQFATKDWRISIRDRLGDCSTGKKYTKADQMVPWTVASVTKQQGEETWEADNWKSRDKRPSIVSCHKICIVPSRSGTVALGTFC